MQILEWWLAGLDPALHGVRTHIAGVLWLTVLVWVCVCLWALRARQWERERVGGGGGGYPLYQAASCMITMARARAHTHTHTHTRTHTHISDSIHKSSQRVSTYCSDWASGICVLEHKRVQRQHTEGQTIGTSSLNWYKTLIQIKLRSIRWLYLGTSDLA